MMILDKLLMGFGQALTPAVLLYTFAGAFIGTAIGVLPGLGPVATIGILLPITFGVDPLGAMALLCGVYYGAQYGGSTTSILLNIPGESASVVTCLDGYQMAKQGRGGVALGISAIGSFVAGLFATAMLVLIGEPLSRMALSFGPAEYTILMALGLSMATSLGGNQTRAMIMCVLGLMVSTMGTDSFTGVARFTFGMSLLDDGLDLVPVLMGLFALGDILGELEHGVVSNPDVLAVSTRLRDVLPKWKDLKESAAAVTRGTLLGFFVSALPGIGAATTSFISYGLERRISRHPEKFGQGAIEGVAGPESANNAAASGAMVPLLTLGIPGTASAAILAGGLMMYGLVPGPMLFKDNPQFVYGLIATMFVGNAMLVVLNLPLIGWWVRLLKVPLHILYPVVIAFMVLGAFAANYNPADVITMAVFGFLGYVARKSGFPPAPFILGFFLGPMFETSLRRALIVGRGDPLIFFQRPISLVLVVLIVLVLAGPTLVGLITKKVKPARP